MFRRGNLLLITPPTKSREKQPAMIILFLLAEPSLSACQEISSIDEDDIEEDGDGDDDDDDC